jgi:hypothetical protein
MLAILSGVGSRRANLRITRTKTCVLSRARSYKPLRIGLSRERVGRAPHRPMRASRGWTSHARERVAAASTSRIGCHALRRSPRASRAGCRERAAGELRCQGRSTSSRGHERVTPGATSRRGHEQQAHHGRAARAGCAGRGRASAKLAQGSRWAATGTPRRDGRKQSQGSGQASRAQGRAGHAVPPRQGRAQAATGAGRAGLRRAQAATGAGRAGLRRAQGGGSGWARGAGATPGAGAPGPRRRRGGRAARDCAGAAPAAAAAPTPETAARRAGKGRGGAGRGRRGARLTVGEGAGGRRESLGREERSIVGKRMNRGRFHDLRAGPTRENSGCQTALRA